MPLRETGGEPGRDRAGGTIDAHNISITSMLNLDSDADADALSITAFVPTAVGMALGGNYSQASNIAEIGDGANVSANSISIVAGGDGNVPFDYSATAATLAAGLGGNVAGSVAVNAMMNHTAVRIGEDAFVVSDTPIDLLANLRRSGALRCRCGHGPLRHIRRRDRASRAKVQPARRSPERLRYRATSTRPRSATALSSVRLAISKSGPRRTTTSTIRRLAARSSSCSPPPSAAAFNYTNTEARARVDGSVITGTGKLEVVADSTNTYSPEAIGLAAAGLISIAGAIEANVIGNKSSAGIGSGGLILADSVTVNAHDESDLDLDTGVLAVGLAAAGVSASVNVMSNTVEAYIGDKLVITDVGGVNVWATSNYDVDALALVSSVTGIVGGVANITINALSNTTCFAQGQCPD